MADFYTNYPAAQKPMTLGEMLNMASGVQNYQQTQQMNPLALQKAQMEVEQSKQMNPLAVRKATAETGKSELEFGAAQYQKFADIAGARATDEEMLNAVKSGNVKKAKQLITQDIDDLVKAGLPKEYAYEAGAQMLKLAGDNLSAVPMAYKNIVRQSVSPESRLGLQKPTMTTNVAGQTVAANPVTGQFQPMGTPQTNPMGIRAQIQTDPATGNLIEAPLTPQGTYGAPRNLMGAPQGNLNQQFSNQPSNTPQAIPQGAHADTVKAQATTAINTYLGANRALTDASVAGHIPTQEMIAKKLLTYLKDPSVNTGPIADVLAGKSNQATLSAKEQEVLKLIQQRIQNLNPRTDADAQSKKDAYGSFRLKKDALNDLIRQDMGSIANQKLLAQGVMNAAGDAKNPNLPAVNSFQNRYREFSQNPALMQYIGIVGTGTKAQIDSHDEAALKRLFSENKLGKDEIAALEAQRKELVKLSGGQ
jgi:hypothetical protein